MHFRPARFIEAMENSNLSNENLLNILEKKYNISLTIDAIKSYRRKSGKNASPSIEKLSAIASILHVSTDYLVGKDDIKPVKKIPIKGTASCGVVDGNHLQDTGEYSYYNGDFYKPTLYCVIANGDSMAPEIEDGDEITCDPDVEPQNGDIVHYTLRAESAIKVYFKDEDAFMVQFIPYNPSDNFKTKTIRLDDDLANELKVSKVVAINKLKFNNRLSRLKLIGKA